MTAEQLTQLAGEAIAAVGLTDTSVVGNPETIAPNVWRVKFDGLKAGAQAEIAIAIDAKEPEGSIAEKLRRELRLRRCPVCVGRATFTPHSEQGQEREATNVDCEACGRFLITWPAMLAFRNAHEQNTRAILERLRGLQQTIRLGNGTLAVTQDNWLALADAARRLR